ncbi:hypothetical protein KIN20_020537 [Parelaphostrongylus tenuis]|uniref:Uncharacterized protein n=1 Tax=Parelaphostrongylus tenuis TaxID=148309 RepID=A0AAD5MML4_PARTN|nr:hypothetical protein KIN20_019255 [Parelaphostrongylus tenuis]KAJ1361320.1 hypothetical protein KIN20_020537 [Parelaphostrongylus tenuis]
MGVLQALLDGLKLLKEEQLYQISRAAVLCSCARMVISMSKSTLSCLCSLCVLGVSSIITLAS